MVGFLKVAKRLFQNVLSERLGTKNFYCEKRVPKRSNITFPQCKQNVYATFPQRFQRLQNVLLKRLETQNLIAKKEFLDVKKRSRNVNKTLTHRFHNVCFVSWASLGPGRPYKYVCLLLGISPSFVEPQRLHL